jgi:hypothetical protein
LVVGGQIVPPIPVDGLAALAGQTASARGVTVEDVPADEGFWVRVSPELRVWVLLVGGGESPVSIEPGNIVDVDGVLRAADGAPGVPAEAADAGAYVEVAFDEVRIAV